MNTKQMEHISENPSTPSLGCCSISTGISRISKCDLQAISSFLFARQMFKKTGSSLPASLELHFVYFSRVITIHMLTSGLHPEPVILNLSDNILHNLSSLPYFHRTAGRSKSLPLPQYQQSSPLQSSAEAYPGSSP